MSGAFAAEVRKGGAAATRGTLLALLLVGVSPALPAAGQATWASPEVGWTQLRGFTVGARIGQEVVGGLDLVLQGLKSFPDEAGVVDTRASARRSAWRTSMAATYAFDRTRAIAPYVGAGLRYGRATLEVTSGGYRAGEVRSGFGLDLLGGIRLPRLPASPWLEYRKGGERWTVTGGVHWRLGGVSGDG